MYFLVDADMVSPFFHACQTLFDFWKFNQKKNLKRKGIFFHFNKTLFLLFKSLFL